MRKNKFVKFAILPLIILLGGSMILSLVYFLLINTVFKDYALLNVALDNQTVAFKKNSEIESLYNDQYLKKLPEFLQIKYLDHDITIATKDLQPKLSTKDVVGFGKNEDIFDTVSDAARMIKGQVNFDYQYEVSLDAVLSQLPFKISSTDSAYIAKESLLNCDTNTFNLTVDKAKLTKDVSESLKNNSILIFELNNYIDDPSEKRIFNLCSFKKVQEDKINTAFSNLKTDSKSNVLKDLDFKVNDDGTTGWEINDETAFSKILEDEKKNTDVSLNQGKYEDHGDKIYLIEPYAVEQNMNIDESISNIKSWLDNPTDSVPLVYDQTNPDVLNTGKDILDFTQLYAEGKSRINLFFGTNPNPFVDNSRVGLLETDDTVLYPGQYYSMYDTLQPHTDGYAWYTKNNRVIDSGICNSATTMFRGALEAGLNITDRSNHIFNVPKYLWDYPYNVVDATYLTVPKIDLKFQNDLQYPILFKVEFWRDDQNEYQKVKIYTDPRQVKRQVNLFDWKIWDVKAPGIFKGQFRRQVFENGVLMHNDTYYSDYQLPYG